MLTVLLVDDSRTILMSIPAVLTKSGYRVETAGDGTDGLAKVKAGLKPAVILTDLNMPKMDGITFIREADAEADRLAVLRRTQLLDWPPEPQFECRTTALREDTRAAVLALLLLGTAIPLILIAGTIVEKTVVGSIRQRAADYVRSTTSAASASP